MDRWAPGDYALNKAVLDCLMALLVSEQRSPRPLRHQTRFVRRHRPDRGRTRVSTPRMCIGSAFRSPAASSGIRPLSGRRKRVSHCRRTERRENGARELLPLNADFSRLVRSLAASMRRPRINALPNRRRQRQNYATPHDAVAWRSIRASS
jgi:hypothetical protein